MKSKFTSAVEDTGLGAGVAGEMIGYKLRMAQILAFRAFEEKLSKYGKAPRYLGLLSVIREHPGQPQSRLAEAVALRRSSLVNILDQLESDGLLVRKPSPDDRRSNGVWLTEKGEKVTSSLFEEAKLEEARLVQGMSTEQMDCLKSGLSQIISNLNRLTS